MQETSQGLVAIHSHEFTSRTLPTHTGEHIKQARSSQQHTHTQAYNSTKHLDILELMRFLQILFTTTSAFAEMDMSDITDD